MSEPPRGTRQTGGPRLQPFMVEGNEMSMGGELRRAVIPEVANGRIGSHTRRKEVYLTRVTPPVRLRKPPLPPPFEITK